MEGLEEAPSTIYASEDWNVSRSILTLDPYTYCFIEEDSNLPRGYKTKNLSLCSNAPSQDMDTEYNFKKVLGRLSEKMPRSISNAYKIDPYVGKMKEAWEVMRGDDEGREGDAPNGLLDPIRKSDADAEGFASQSVMSSYGSRLEDGPYNEEKIPCLTESVQRKVQHTIHRIASYDHV
ncbi:unnamed protein product [Sphenostylis stenocarpa]|uniref:Uncharacterized protein n=1 Tax=Sphenostylis stenocarpa TaxID=92480 RepID=A0AA86VD61_9FABA|nr:unnamed protein product [Sphenostylis stenocarpa]